MNTMVGVFGTTTADEVDSMAATVPRENWYETERDADAGLALVHHGDRDPRGHTVWRGDDGVGVIHGVVSNADELGLTTRELFDGLLNRPKKLLPRLSGPFLLACYDDRDGSMLAATDKLATRPCYYTDAGGEVAFSSALKAVHSRIPDPSLNEQAVADMLSYGNVLGEQTLLREVRSLPPATVLRVEDGTATAESYWKPTFGRKPTDGYVRETANRYRSALSNVADTVTGDLGLWLSGGLDSRTMASVLRDEYGPFQTFTYDHNPPDGSNLEPARETADRLGVDNEFVEIRPGDFERRIRQGVNLTDGMTSWVYFINPEFILGGLSQRVDAVFEGAPQGELFGEHVWYDHFDRSSSALEAMTAMLRNHRTGEETVSALLTSEVDPDRSIRREVAKSDESDPTHRTMDVWFRNFCSNTHFRAKRLTRSQVATRIPFADGPFVDHLAQMPHERFRREAFPLTGGRIPRSMSPLKRELLCEIDADLSEIPYERTGVAPDKPLVVHDAAFVGKQLRKRMGTTPTPWADWCRDHPDVSAPLNDWLDSACDREVFDADAIRRVQREHDREEANHVRLLAALTTLEIWLDEQFRR